MAFNEEALGPKFCYNCGEIWSMCQCDIPACTYPELVSKLRQKIKELSSEAPREEWSHDFKTLYHDLLMSVGKKHPGETRHQTAKRYILNAERGSDKAKAAKSDRQQRPWQEPAEGVLTTVERSLSTDSPTDK